MKFVGYDERSQSIMVSFASDTTNSPNPESYKPVAFQPYSMWPDVNDMNELQKRIASVGISVVRRQIIEESLTANTGKIQALQELVGQTNQFAVADIVDVQSPTPFHTV